MTNSLRSLVRPLIFLVAFNLLPQFGLRPLWTSLLAVVLVGYRLWLDVNKREMPPRPLLWAGQILIGVSVWSHYHTFIGDEAGGTFLTLLTCVKIYELRAARDFFLTCVLCILVLMSFLLIEQGLLMTGFFLVDMVSIVAFMLALQSDESNWTSWTSWRSGLRPGAKLVLQSLPLLLVTFMLFPRFTTGFGTGTNTIAQTGMSENLRPGSVAKLIESDEVVFRATFLDGDMPSPSRLYWRGAVLDVSDGLNWSRSQPLNRTFKATLPLVHPNVEVYLEPGFGRFLYTSEVTDALSFPNEANRVSPRQGEIFELGEPLVARERYYLQWQKATSAGSDDLPDKIYLHTLQPPSPQVSQLLKGFAGKSDSATVQELLEYLHANGFLYSLQPPEANTIDAFLFKTKVGFCEHYAGTFATLLRYLQIPSRVVLGFQGGTPSILDNYLSVRGHDAHAWVEYYDRDTSRWRRVDPTAQVAPLRLSMGGDSYFRAGQGSFSANWMRYYLGGRAFVEQVEASWVGFLLHFDLAKQRELMAKLGMAEALFRALPVFLLMALVILFSVYYFIGSRQREKFGLEEQIYRQFLMLLRRWRVGRSPQDGPFAIMAKIKRLSPTLAEQVSPWFAKMIEVRFGARKASEKDLLSLKAELKKLRKLKVS